MVVHGPVHKHLCTPQQSRNMIVLALENGITDKNHHKKLLHYMSKFAHSFENIDMDQQILKD